MALSKVDIIMDEFDRKLEASVACPKLKFKEAYLTAKMVKLYHG
jgi:hypothetical protein